VTEAPPKTSRAERARLTQEGILAVALRLFAERGYDATSLQDIADEMKLTKAAVYYHFPTKVEILQALAEPFYVAMSAVIEAAADLGTRRARIDAMAHGFVDVMLSQRAVMSVLDSDPVMHGQMKAAKTMDDLQARGIQVLYGDHPTPDHLLAVAAVAGLADAVSVLHELSDEEIRVVLVRAVKRLIPER
jgi:AcrR family transcriptional regulator